MPYNRRTFNRFDIFPVVEFKPLTENTDTFFGIMNNFSNGGFRLETQHVNFESGETLEFIFKHPKNALFVTGKGQIVWKESIDKFKCLMGIKFKEMDIDDRVKMLEIMSASGDIPVDNFLIDGDIDNGMDKKDNEEIGTTFNRIDKNKTIPEILKRYTKHINAEDPEVKELHFGENSIAFANESDGPVSDIIHTGETANDSANDKTSFKSSSDLSTSECNSTSNQEPGFVSKVNTCSDKPKHNKNMWKYLIIAIVISTVLAYTVLVMKENRNKSKINQVQIPSKPANNQDPLQNSPESSDYNIQPAREPDQLIPLSSKPRKQINSGEKIADKNKVTDFNQSPTTKLPLNINEYYIQVGAWSNPDYAKATLAQLSKFYPDATIVIQNNFNKIRIPGIKTTTHGNKIIKDIEDNFHLKPLLILITP